MLAENFRSKTLMRRIEKLYHQPIPITAAEFRPTTNDFILLGPKRLVWGCCQEIVQAVPVATRLPRRSLTGPSP